MGTRAWRAAAWLALASAPAWAGEGIVRFGADGSTRLFTTETLQPGDAVRVQYRAAGGRTRCCASVTLEAAAAGGNAQLPSDELGGAAVHVYALSGLSVANVERPFAGAAITGQGPAPRQISATELRLGAGAAAPVLFACTTQEGLHLLKLVHGKPATHLYLGFDYSVRPSCPARALRAISG